MLVKVLRTYGGQEARRVKAGTIFAVDEVLPGFVTITATRARQLKTQRLIEEIRGTLPPAPEGQEAATPRRRPSALPGAKVEPDSAPRPAPSSPARRHARARAKQEDAPAAPRPLAHGGQTGEDSTSSSSPADRQVGSVTIKQRGTRRAPRVAAGSESITPASTSSPGRTSSMPAISVGGNSTAAPAGSADSE